MGLLLTENTADIEKKKDQLLYLAGLSFKEFTTLRENAKKMLKGFNVGLPDAKSIDLYFVFGALIAKDFDMYLGELYDLFEKNQHDEGTTAIILRLMDLMSGQSRSFHHKIIPEVEQLPLTSLDVYKNTLTRLIMKKTKNIEVSDFDYQKRYHIAHKGFLLFKKTIEHTSDFSNCIEYGLGAYMALVPNQYFAEEKIGDVRNFFSDFYETMQLWGEHTRKDSHHFIAAFSMILKGFTVNRELILADSLAYKVKRFVLAVKPLPEAHRMVSDFQQTFGFRQDISLEPFVNELYEKYPGRGILGYDIFRHMKRVGIAR